MRQQTEVGELLRRLKIDAKQYWEREGKTVAVKGRFEKPSENKSSRRGGGWDGRVACTEFTCPHIIQILTIVEDTLGFMQKGKAVPLGDFKSRMGRSTNVESNTHMVTHTARSFTMIIPPPLWIKPLQAVPLLNPPIVQ